MNIKKESYDVSDLTFLKLRTNTMKLYNHTVYRIESLSMEEKAAIIDDFEDGIASYLLNVLTMYENEKPYMPRDESGMTRAESLEAFFFRNDPEIKILGRETQDCKYSYYLFGREYIGLSTTCPFDANGGRIMYSRNHVIHQWFHDFIEKMRKAEQRWLDGSAN